MWIKKFLNTYHAPLFDTLYLFNIALTSAMVLIGKNSQAEMQSVAGLNILILMALAQLQSSLSTMPTTFSPYQRELVAVLSHAGQPCVPSPVW